MPFADPKSTVALLGPIEGCIVADLGAGTGAYAIPLAEAVGGKGKVYAVDVQKDLLSKLRNTALSRGLMNIETLWGDIEQFGSTKLKDGSVDIVVVANVMFQVDDKMGLASEAKRIMREGGILLFVDWKDSFGGLGPRPSAIVSFDEAKRCFGENGFVFDRMIDAGSHHFGFIMSKHISGNL